MPAISSDESRGHQLFAWPGWGHIAQSAGLGLLFVMWLELIYGGADYVTSLRVARVPVHFRWELAIPFVPEMTVFYVSIFPMFWISPFVLRTAREMVAFYGCLASATLVAGVVFLLIPSESAFPAPEVPAFWNQLYNAADTLNLTYNMLPSLHVTCSILCVDIYSRRATRGGKLLFCTWGFMIALSTLLTHMHHLLDVISGFLLAMFVSRCCYGRWAGWKNSHLDNQTP